MLRYRILALLIVIGLHVTIAASPADELQSATEEDKVVFLLVTEQGAPGIEQAKEIIQGAMAEVDRSVTVELDRADVANASLAAKYGLSGAPVPLILVFASNGAMAGGNLASKLTKQGLVSMVPSPKKAEVLKALQAGQAVFLTATRDGMSTKSEVASCCATASGQMRGKCTSINVDMEDPAEALFLKLLKVDMQATEPVTVVVNAQGQVTGSFNGPMDVAKLVQAATRKVSGCCPSGSGKTCGPTPEKKKGK